MTGTARPQPADGRPSGPVRVFAVVAASVVLVGTWVAAVGAVGTSAGEEPTVADATVEVAAVDETPTTGETPTTDAASPVDDPIHSHAGPAEDGPAAAGAGSIVSLYDPRLSADQRQAARELIDETHEAMQRYPDVDAVLADGYVSIGDWITGWEHFIHPGHMADGRDLDPERIESIVARVRLDGSREIVSAMYILGPDATMDDVPDIAGSLTTWHDHQDLCWVGHRVVGVIRSDGSCRAGEFRGTPPMLHVWMVPHPCGPFAGIEGHGRGCGHDH